MEHFHGHLGLLSFDQRTLKGARSGSLCALKRPKSGRECVFTACPRTLAVFLNFSDEASEKGPSDTDFTTARAQLQPTVCTHVTLPHRLRCARPERPFSPLIGQEAGRRGSGWRDGADARTRAPPRAHVTYPRVINI